MANGEPSQSWRIEVEQTDRFVRSREYRLGGPQSLSWAKYYYERDKENPFEMKLDCTRQVEPWPDLEWEVEAEVPELDPADPYSDWRHFREPSFLDERVKAIPGNYSVSSYLLGMVDQGRRPRRVRIEYQQSAYRGVCTITVLAWGELEAGREDYVAKPSRNGMVMFAMAVAADDDHDPEPIPPLSAFEKSLSMDGLSLGMPSHEVLELWRASPLETKVVYRHDRGTIVLLSGSSLEIQGKSYAAGTPATPLVEHLKGLGFEEIKFPRPQTQDEESLKQMKAMEEKFKMLSFAATSVTLQLAGGTIESIFLAGGSEDYEFEDRGLNWMGSPPTIHGLSISLGREQLLEKLGSPDRTHRAGVFHTLCYDPEPCQDSVHQPVKLHVTFEGERCRAIRGTQLEQSGEIRLGSRFQMPPPHSLQGVELILSSFDSFHTRNTERKEGPVTVGYCTDLGLEVWIYPDGKRQFILRDIDLPKTVINLDFP